MPLVKPLTVPEKPHRAAVSTQPWVDNTQVSGVLIPEHANSPVHPSAQYIYEVGTMVATSLFINENTGEEASLSDALQD